MYYVRNYVDHQWKVYFWPWGIIGNQLHKDIINVDQDEVMEVLPEHLIHKTLAYGRNIDQAIRHDPVHVVPHRCYKAGLTLVPLPYPNEVICTS